MFVRGRWVDFEALAISWFYQLQEDDNEEYQAPFVGTDFEGLMQVLTQGQGVWRLHPSTGEFTTFPMTTLTPVATFGIIFYLLKLNLYCILVQ